MSSPLAEGAALELAEPQAHYLGSVMRLSPGDGLALFNGADGEFEARIATLGRRRAGLAVGARLRPQPPAPSLELVIAALKRDAMDLVARAATELGVAAIRPVFTARTNAGRVGTARLAAIATEAAEQCTRCDVPAVAEPVSLTGLLDGWPGAWPDGRRLVLADESGTAPPAALALARLAGPLSVLVGPEGGFTPAELDALRVRAFVTPVGLGPRILRAGTAAIAALALVQALAGDWRSP